jgi:hypothetical protein
MALTCYGTWHVGAAEELPQMSKPLSNLEGSLPIYGKGYTSGGRAPLLQPPWSRRNRFLPSLGELDVGAGSG